MKRSLLACCVLAWALLASGCQGLQLNALQFWNSSPDDDDEDEKVKTPLISDKVTVAGLSPIMVEAVGLVVGLDNTGEDPPPSLWRTMLMEDLKRRNVKNPHAVLQSPATALVLIRASIPPVIQHGDRFDIEVVLPEGTNATSLAGGWLMEADLAERTVIPGRQGSEFHKGHILAKCKGPILLSTGDADKSSLPSLLKRGKVLGGAVYVGGILKEDRKLGLYLRHDLKSIKQSKRIADRIGQRFHHHVKGIKQPLSNAKTDQHIELKIHPRYKENYIRYVQVIKHIAMNETPLEQRRRVERLRRQLLSPNTASGAAMELEAIGKESIPVLKEGLESPIAEVQFYAADALAYLEDDSGAEILAKMVKEEEAFRVFALASLTNLEGTANNYLRELMNESSAETRYGGFRALQTLDRNDHFLAKERIGDQFNLYVLRTKGEPMVHLTRHRVPEVVLFGADQRLEPPLALSAGRHILVSAQAGSDTVTVGRFEAGRLDRKKSVSLRLADVLRALGEVGATYPDCAQLLSQAKRASNLSGRLEFDALPQAGRIYHRPETGPASFASSDGMKKKSATRVGELSMSPNIFPILNPESGRSGEDSLDDGGRGDKPKTDNDRKDGLTERPGSAATGSTPVNDPAADKTAENTSAQANPAEKKPGLLARLFGSGSAPDQSEPESVAAKAGAEEPLSAATADADPFSEIQTTE